MQNRCFILTAPGRKNHMHSKQQVNHRQATSGHTILFYALWQRRQQQRPKTFFQSQASLWDRELRNQANTLYGSGQNELLMGLYDVAPSDNGSTHKRTCSSHLRKTKGRSFCCFGSGNWGKDLSGSACNFSEA